MYFFTNQSTLHQPPPRTAHQFMPAITPSQDFTNLHSPSHLPVHLSSSLRLDLPSQTLPFSLYTPDSRIDLPSSPLSSHAPNPAYLHHTLYPSKPRPESLSVMQQYPLLYLGNFIYYALIIGNFIHFFSEL